MRVGVFVALLVAALALAGCTSNDPGSGDSSSTSSTSHSTSSSATSTSRAPGPSTLTNRAPTTVFAATVGTGMESLRVAFSVNASDPDGDLLRWVLDFGDGTTQRVGTLFPTVVNHTYASAGTYNATLDVSDGSLSTESLFVVNARAPTAPASSSSSSSASSSSSTSASSTSSSSSTTTSSSSTTTSSGPNTAPVANLTADRLTGQAPVQVNFTVNGTDADGDALSFTLEFGDGTNQTGTTMPAVVAHPYTSARTYTANLTVRDGRGGANMTSLVITVSAPPASTFPFTYSEDVVASCPHCGDTGPIACASFLAGMPGGDCVFTVLPAGSPGRAFTINSSVGDPDAEFMATCDPDAASTGTSLNPGPEAGTVPAGSGCLVAWEFLPGFGVGSTITLTVA